MRTLRASLIALGLLFTTHVAAQPPSPPVAAPADAGRSRDLAADAASDLAVGRFAHAAVTYEELWAKNGEPSALTRAADAYLRIGTASGRIEAVRTLHQFLALQPSADERAGAEAMLAVAEGRVPSPQKTPSEAPVQAGITTPAVPMAPQGWRGGWRGAPYPMPVAPSAPERRVMKGFLVPGIALTGIGVSGAVPGIVLLTGDEGDFAHFLGLLVLVSAAGHLGIGLPLLIKGARGEEVDPAGNPIEARLVFGPGELGVLGRF